MLVGMVWRVDLSRLHQAIIGHADLVRLWPPQDV